MNLTLAIVVRREVSVCDSGISVGKCVKENRMWGLRNVDDHGATHLVIKLLGLHCQLKASLQPVIRVLCAASLTLQASKSPASAMGRHPVHRMTLLAILAAGLP